MLSLPKQLARAARASNSSAVSQLLRQALYDVLLG
jgi:hypothetical protein